MHWKDFFYFSSAEKIAILILLVVIVLSFGLNVMLSRRSSAPVSIPQNDSLIAAFQRLHDNLEDKKVVTRSYENNSKKRTQQTYPHDKERQSTDNHQNNNYSERPTYTKQEKFTTTGSISLNETDTAQWKMVPGIGSAFSERIVKYGDKLGGYQSINQLKEVYGVTDDLFDAIAPFIREEEIGLEHCVKLNVNQLEFKEILAHPYINYEQTKAIVNLRRRTGNITSLNELAMLEEFTAEDIKRIASYIDF